MSRKRYYPAGRKPGLKLDPKYRDRYVSIEKAAGYEPIPEKYWAEQSAIRWVVEKDLRYPYTSDQDAIGECACHGKDNTYNACADKQGQPSFVKNPSGTYYTVSGGVDRGSVIGHNLEFGATKGCFPEEVWSVSKGWRTKPSAFAYEVASFFRIREYWQVPSRKLIPSVLLSGFFVQGGAEGHSTSFSRWVPGSRGGKIRYKNSWGNWGDNGFGYWYVDEIIEGYGIYAYKDVVVYYDPLTGKWGRTEDDGTFTECPWKPKHNQAKLAAAVNEYQSLHTARKIKGQRPMSANHSEDTYQQMLAKYGLAV